MKTSIFKSSIFAAVFALLSSVALAQNLPDASKYVKFKTDAGYRERIDTVTVGSRMPYRMAGDADIAALVTAGVMNTSLFKWVFSPAITIKSPDGTGNPAVNGTYANYYAVKEISAVMPSSTQLITLTVNERSMPKIGTGCEGTDSTWSIQVVAKPTLHWPATKELGGCVAEAVVIPLTLTGYSQWEVTYDVLYTAYTSSATPSAIKSNEVLTVSSVKELTLAATIFTQPGKYEVRITKLSDRISRKSLDEIIAVAGTDIPAATDMFTVNIYPAPKTQILEHVRNF
jgi:hypothetical protein